jgi:prepilin-type N-terminal cleavage/methylation domain-containing protein
MNLKHKVPRSTLKKAIPTKVGASTVHQNGFSLVEVIVALLVMSLALAGIFELFRAGLAYRSVAEASATSIESAALVKRALDESLGEAQRDLIGVSESQVTYRGRPLLKISNVGKAYRLERFVLTSRRARLAQSFILKTPDLRFEPEFNRNGQLVGILIMSQISQKGGRKIQTALAMSPVHVTGQRPCAYDALVGQCTDLTQ